MDAGISFNNISLAVTCLMVQRILVIGDIHGACKALDQCFSRAGYNHAQDTLICLGDVTDGWPQTRECIDLLLTLPRLV